MQFTFYVLYQRWHVQPRLAKNPDTPPEIRLELGVMAGPLVPVSLLIFGWTAGRTHWMGPVVGAGLYLPPVRILSLALTRVSKRVADQTGNVAGLSPLPKLPHVLLPELPDVRGFDPRRQRLVPVGHGVAVPALWRQVLPSARSRAWMHFARRLVGAPGSRALREFLAPLSSSAFCFLN